MRITGVIEGFYGPPWTHAARLAWIDWLHEHAQVPWQMFHILVKRDDGDWHWPDKQWLPLALSLQATRR